MKGPPMNITRKSVLSGKVSTLDIPVTSQKLIAYESRVSVQDAFPDLSPAEREFVRAGITVEEWAAVYSPDEDD